MADKNTEEIERVNYSEENILHLSDVDHIRTRPGMYRQE